MWIFRLKETTQYSFYTVTPSVQLPIAIQYAGNRQMDRHNASSVHVLRVNNVRVYQFCSNSTAKLIDPHIVKIVNRFVASISIAI